MNISEFGKRKEATLTHVGQNSVSSNMKYYEMTFYSISFLGI